MVRYKGHYIDFESTIIHHSISPQHILLTASCSETHPAQYSPEATVNPQVIGNPTHGDRHQTCTKDSGTNG